ncbi:uncharacterized protein CTRU02_202734 [Colletotrichum truncatum]|uniref:Uncharacterized protein n=1 Tax=Colletotrichum truncatum TaxID=5467 RepID=A0ACC3ZL39_COLTU|nr:uncharacterized protein CTRU02_10658 [Colletotrichum truncatum]KAF6786959.1 hypothetical protein CTRU02_10658 [Colletotrichum truncatum]
MVPNILPNWARVFLSIATVLSYLPQYHRITEQGTCDGLSLYYVFFMLISATEQISIGFFLNVNGRGLPREDVFVNNPATLGDWCNLAQLAVVWVSVLALFIQCLRYSSFSAEKRAAGCRLLVIYICFLCVSLIPMVVDAIYANSRSERRQYARDAFLFAHYLGFLPVSSILTLAAVIPQAREIRRRQGRPGALSLPSLAAQSVISAILAISWMIRVKYPPYLPSWDGWYRLIGWPVVNNGLSAFVQGALLWRALCSSSNDVQNGEMQPLLVP